MAKRASLPLLLLAALIGSAAAAPRAPLALHVMAALVCGSVRALVAQPLGELGVQPTHTRG